jgi:pimeloyl-ACP methyl ester carboxylesterase
MPSIRKLSICFFLLPAIPSIANQSEAQQQATIPAAISTDPPSDKAYPAAMNAFQISSHGSALNAIAYLAAGAGPHPVALILHGFPGNEKNLDLAQAIRRAGWDAVYFDYRGSWGSPGAFSFGNATEDTMAAIAYLREPANAARLRLDPNRIVVVGHSMGGMMAAYAGSHNPGILGTVMISAAAMGRSGDRFGPDVDPKTKVKMLAATLEKWGILPLAGCTGESLATELLENRKKFDFIDYSNLFENRPVLLVSADDGLKPDADMLASKLRSQGNTNVQEVHFATDHSYSDQRIALEATVLNWLASLSK